MAKKRSSQREEEEVREMSTSNPQQIKHRDLLNPANPELNRNLYWSLKFLLMSVSLDFRTPANQLFFQWFLLPDQKLPIILLLRLSQTSELSVTETINHL